VYCKDLKVVNLNITEDFYIYKGVFQLCSSDKSMEIDLADFSDYNERKLKEIKNYFDLNDSLRDIYKIIMDKVMDAAKIQSRVIENYSY